MTELVADYAGRRSAIVRLGKTLGGGASGDIYHLNRRPGFAAKIYRSPGDRQKYEAKIEDMIRRPPPLKPITHNGKTYPQIAWPEATLRDKSGGFLGFVMPEVDLKSATELENVLQRSARKAKGLPEFYGGRVLLAANLAALITDLHSLAHYFIDMKPMNLSFYPATWYLAIVDTDGFSIQGTRRWPAQQYSQEYIAPEAKDRSPSELGVEQDLFALAVIVFRLLNNGVHPYQGIDKISNQPTSLQERIFAGLYAYGTKASSAVQPSAASIHEYLEPSTRILFDRAFAGPPSSRPSASEWSNHLRGLITGGIFVKCSVNPKEHGHFSKGCGLCALDAKRQQAAASSASSSFEYRQMSGASIRAPSNGSWRPGSASPPAQAPRYSPAPAPAPVNQPKRKSRAWKWAGAAALGSVVLLALVANRQIESTGVTVKTSDVQRSQSPTLGQGRTYRYRGLPLGAEIDLQLWRLGSAADGSGALQGTYVYTAYNNPVEVTGSIDSAGRFSFQGKYQGRVLDNFSGSIQGDGSLVGTYRRQYDGKEASFRFSPR